MKKIDDVSKDTGLSRRMIQEYEKAGLAIKPEKRNKYGHLLYDTEESKRLWQLRFYKELGYDKSEIRSVMESSSYDQQKEIEQVTKLLVQKREWLDNLIAITQMMQETGVCFNSFNNMDIEDDGLCFDDWINILGTIISIGQQTFDKICSHEDGLPEEDMNTGFTAFKQVLEFCDGGKDVCAEEVQSQIALIHKVISKMIPKSILILNEIAVCFAPGGRIAADIDRDYGEGKAVYFYNALRWYCDANADNEVDREFIIILDNIRELGIRKYRADSEEVQTEVKKIYHFWDEIDGLSYDTKVEMLRSTGELFGSKAYIKVIDNGNRRGISWFISRAILIYWKELQKNL